MSGLQKIPAHITRLMDKGNVKQDLRDVIALYLISEDGAVQLNDEQLKKLERVEEADRLMRSSRWKRLEMQHLIAKKFKVSLSCARRDLNDAEYIFGNVRKPDKRYQLGKFIDYITDAVEIARQLDGALWQKLLELQLKAISQIPDEAHTDLSPSVIILNITHEQTRQISDVEISKERARKKAMQVLHNGAEDVDYQDIPHEQ